MSPVGKLITSGVGLAVSALVMVGSGFMLALMNGPGPYHGNKHEVNVAGGVFCVSTLVGLACFVGVVLSLTALSRQRASRTSAPPR